LYKFKLAGAWTISIKFIAVAAIVIILIFGLVIGKELS
jgi:hypothetical protein